MTEETRREAIKASRTAAFWSLLGFIVVALATAYIIIRLNSVSAEISEKKARLTSKGVDESFRVAPTAYAREGTGDEYQITLWIDLFRSNFLEPVKKIAYKCKNTDYPLHGLSSSDRAQAFRVTYSAACCVDDVELQVIFANGDSTRHFSLCDVLNQQRDKKVPPCE